MAKRKDVVPGTYWQALQGYPMADYMARLCGLPVALASLSASEREALSTGTPCSPPDPMLDNAFRNIRSALPLERLEDWASTEPTKRRIATKLSGLGTQTACKTAGRLWGCGESQLAMQAPSGKAALAPYRCSLRLCPVCSRNLSLDQFGRYWQHHQARNSWMRWKLSWLTLTVKNCTSPNLEQTVRSILKAWRQFRRKDEWKTYARGYIWNLEITRNNAKSTWHPHVHVIADAPEFRAWQTLKTAWQNATEQQGLVGNLNLGRCYDPSKRQKRDGIFAQESSAAGFLREITKYTLKPFEDRNTPASEIMALIDALRNKRLHGADADGTMHAPKSQKTSGYILLGGLGRMLEDPESPAYTDTAFGQSLCSAIVSRKDLRAKLIDAYEKASMIIAADLQNDHREKDEVLTIIRPGR